jgi:hypothetical protein
MSYVCEHVAKDHHSLQTPHYGIFDGDGDLIFNPPADIATPKPEGNDLLIELVPSGSSPHGNDSVSPAEFVKEYLSDARYRIRLDDFTKTQVRRVLPQLDDQFFRGDPRPTAENFGERLNRYETVVSEILPTVALVAKWGDRSHRPLLESVFARIAEADKPQVSYAVWVGLTWYPTTLLMYAAGIAALSAQNYGNLASALTTKIGEKHTGKETREVIVPAVNALLEVVRTDLFNRLPGHDRYYVPANEYLFKIIQPPLEDLFFLGRSYELLFDTFEVFRALVFGDLTFGGGEGESLWGPPGRFAWKYRSSMRSSDPFRDVVAEAKSKGDAWGPIQAGLFHGSVNRFLLIAEKYEALMPQFGWH